MLTAIILMPLVAALIIFFVPGNYRFLIRLIALATTLVTMLSAIALFWRFPTGTDAFAFEQKVSWVRSLGINYHVGVDGLNIGLVLMAAVIVFAAVCVSWEIRD